MSDNDSPTGAPIDVHETLSQIADIPVGLPGDPRRQAVPSIKGIIYQAWWSIEAWLKLANDGEVIYLEGAEDFEIVSASNVVTVQVKHTTSSISLGTKKAREALENFWALSSKEPARRVDFHFLTTSSITVEKDANFGGLGGIEIWRAAQTSLDLTIELTNYLSTKLEATSPLRGFLNTSKPEDIQEKLIKRFHWITNQPDINVVRQSVDKRIANLLINHRQSIALTPMVRKYLESRFWEIVQKSPSSQRRLTYSELLLQLEVATTVYLPLPVDQLPDLIGNALPGLNLLNLLLEKLPRPPEPLLQRPALTQRLEDLIKYRKAILLTGTVHKGKTSVAQLVTSNLCPEAWWVNLTERQFYQIDNVLLALASKIESRDCPDLVVIDDLNISPIAHRAYRDSLALLLHRASKAGRGVLITAQGDSSDSVVIQDLKNIEIVDVPELSLDETEYLCVAHGCPPEIAKMWGSLITGWTGGHPKLVQVHIAELAGREWPSPSANDLTTQSPAVTSARQLARQLLSDSVSAPIAEFVYLVSECSVPMHRSVALRLAETVEGLKNGGDVLDNLAGKWLERIDGQWFRATGLLKGVTAKVWSPEKLKRAHIRLHDAILAKKTLDPSEAAALIFHAYLGGEPRRLAQIALHLQMSDDKDMLAEVEKHLLWLPYVALDDGQSISDDAMAGVILRGLQYRVASTLDSDCLPQICTRWRDDIERISIPEAKMANQALLWLSTSFTENLKVPLKFRLEAILGIPTLSSELLEMQSGVEKQFFSSADIADDLPNNGTTTQIIFLLASRAIVNLSNLEELLQWLDTEATDEIRQQFDDMLEWPLVQTLGAFVQGAWSSAHEKTDNWEPWIALFERVDEYARRRGSLHFGREASKGRAIILTEYLDRAEEALTVLDDAEAAFGLSTILMEQRANVMFQAQDDETVLDIWHHMTSDPAQHTILDPFAFRRAGISASRLKRWDKAGQIFRSAADSIKPGTFEITKFGLSVDAALAMSLGGDQLTAANTLANAVSSLPAEAAMEGNARWEAVQRVAVGVCLTIENYSWRATAAKQQVGPGDASWPELKVSKIVPGQPARSEMIKAQAIRLCSILSTDSVRFTHELEILADSDYSYVRSCSIEALLAQKYSSGAGEGFVETLLAFDKFTAELLAGVQEGRSLLEPDHEEASTIPVAPERWFGLLCAGVVCSGPNILSHLNIWLDASCRLLGEESSLTNIIRLLLQGASLPAEDLEAAVFDAAAPPSIRCGAAAQSLQGVLTAEKTLQLQSILTSGLVVDDSYARQELFNFHIARQFASSWRIHARNSFQFCSPSKSVPALLATLNEVDRGNGSLKSVLTSAASALRQPLGEFIERVS